MNIALYILLTVSLILIALLVFYFIKQNGKSNNSAIPLDLDKKIDELNKFQVSVLNFIYKQEEFNKEIIRTISDNDKNVNKSKKYIYSARFEEFWELYAKKTDKGRAYACYNARLKEGYTEDEIIEACKAYMEECKRTKREKIYIKDPKTFLSVHKPFVEYIPKKDKDTGLKMEDGALVFNLDYGDETPPYYGLPKEWYDGDKLVQERMTPIKQPATPKMGLYNDKIYSVEEVYKTYKVRRDYFDRQGNS